MNRTLRRASLIAMAATAILLSGCANTYYSDYTYAQPVYYDGYYGPYYDGYWGPDGFFFFDVRVNKFVRDDGRHFRREASPGFQQIPRTRANVARAMRPVPPPRVAGPRGGGGARERRG
jgi:hypothetical protein